MNNSKSLLLTIMAIFAINALTIAQEIRGADMDFVRTAEFRYQINIDLYFAASQEVDRPYITLFLGDGFQDTAWLNNQENIAQGLWKLSFDVEHEYPGEGKFSIWLLDTIPLPEINNYDYQEGDNFIFYGDLLVWANPFGQNSSPIFINDQTDTTFNDGKWQHQMEIENPDGDTLLCFYYDFPYFAYPGFTLPAAVDSFNLNSPLCKVNWNRPYQAGKFLIPLFVQDYLHLGGSSYLVSTRAHRLMTVKITEEDIIASTNSLEKPELQFSISPNPGHETTTIFFSSHESTSGQLSLYDLNGRQLFSNGINILEGSNREIIDLKYIPPGIYFLSLQTKNGYLVLEKLVVF